MAKKKQGKVTVLEAVDTLSHLADLDVENPERVEWLDPAKVEQNQAAIRATFSSINSYLQHLYQKDRQELARPQTQKGIRSMMQLAGEALDKVGQYTEIFQGAHVKDDTIAEFKKLQQFYLAKVFSKLQKESQEERWELEDELQGSDESRQVLKDLDSVRQDQDYELFYMTYDDGTPFYTSHLLRHLRMVGNFDETFIAKESGERENLLSKLEVLWDREIHLSAQKLLSECSDLIDLFYQEALQHKENEAILQVSKSVMALLLAANPKNLKHNSLGKHCMDYWSDFVMYLRLALQTESYSNWLQRVSSVELYQTCLKLMHRMCHMLFLRPCLRYEDRGLVHSIVGKTLEGAHSIWTLLVQAESKLQDELQNYPSGPLTKTLKMFREQKEKRGFDPFLQGNPAGQFFSLTTETLHTTVIHMPAPVHRTTPEQGEIIGEYRGFLHSLGHRCQLYINLQDSTSWKEHLPCKLLEELSGKGEFSENFHLITLAKDTDFYHQIKHFGEMTDAQQFCRVCVEHILGGSETGFYFPSGKTPKAWIEPLIRFVHHQFFTGKPLLDRKQRLDFIEIVYFFIVLRYVDQEKPDIMNFSCKDGVDTGAAASAAFYGFARMLSSKSAWTERDRDCLLYAFFSPALFIRHRSIDMRRMHRVLSALEHFELALQANRDGIIQECAKILPEMSLKEIKMIEVA